MKTKDIILKLIAKKGQIRAADVLKVRKISHPTLAQHFRELILAGKLIRIGTTRNAVYQKPKTSKLRGHHIVPKLSLTYKRHGLTEDRVYTEINQRLRLDSQVSKQASQIFGFACNEMVNNAIEHSQSKTVTVHVWLDGLNLRLEVIDQGIGLFENVRKKFALTDHFEAINLLLKGKQTTAPEHHSGQGVFFTSRIVDQFEIQSSALTLTVDQIKAETFLTDTKAIRGTVIRFAITQRTKKDIKAIFDAYSNDEFEFDKTMVTVHLIKSQGAFLSRSEARRIVVGLDKFKRVVLDFKNVTSVGQGFADEIFRVFQQHHPAIHIETINTLPSVTHMIQWAIQGLKPYNSNS